jgi:transcriptional regulator with XRE-family HTH domain
MVPVGGRIRTLRAEREMTLDELAKKSGLSKGLLSKLENLPDANPSLETLYGISEALDVTLGDLLDSGAIQAKRIIPDKKPHWIDSLTAALRNEGKKPDEDILQALYVLQTRKGAAQKGEAAWFYMYKSLELALEKSRK